MAGIIYTPPPVTPTPPTPPGGSADQLQYNDGLGGFGGAAYLSQKNGFLQSISINSPNSAPAASDGHAIVYTDNGVGNNFLRVSSKVAIDTPLQNSIGHKVIGLSITTSNSGLTHYFNFASFTSITGTQSRPTRLWDTLNPLNNYTHTRITSAAVINSAAEYWGNTTTIGAIVGSTDNNAGARLVITFGLDTYVTTQRIFAGYSASASQIMGAGDPSNLLNIVGVAKDSGDTNFQIIFNDGAGAATKFNTGIAPTALGVYRVEIFIQPNGSEFFVRLCVLGMNSTSYYGMSQKNNIPASGNYMTVHAGAATTTATAVQFGIISIYEEQF
jgi:hypothetical protein